MAVGAECIWTLLHQPESKPLKQGRRQREILLCMGVGGGGGGEMEQEGGEMMSE